MHRSLKTTMVALCQEVCEAYEEDDRNYLARKITELGLADRQNAPKAVWEIIGEIQPSFQGPSTNLNSKQDLMGEWRKYFAKLLNTPPMEIDLAIKTGDYTRTEGQVAIQSLKDSKAPGIDSVMWAEAMKYGGERLLDKLVLSLILWKKLSHS